ncbi:MAG: glycoside hydrolase family 2, partial [Cyanothece sp. SIO1E1]|nr:glycoside hydrolase family 2 [Cyanothece sp. SIO1E1]
MFKLKAFYKALLIVLITGIFSGCLTNAQPIPLEKSAQPRTLLSRTIPLAGQWQFWADPASVDSSPHLQPTHTLPTYIDQGNWQPIAVPSNWFLQGQDFAGVAWYQRHFEIDPNLQGKVIKLVFEGVDYAADVWLNGEYLGFHEGYFQPFSFLVSEQLHFGTDNVLVVRVNSPKEAGGADWSLHKRLIKGIFSHHDTRPGGAWSDRGQEQNTGGIWAPAYLQISEIVAIEAVKITPQLELEDNRAIAQVNLTLNYPGPKPEDVEMELQLVPENFPGEPS